MAGQVRAAGDLRVWPMVALLALVVLLNFVDRGAIGIAAPLMQQSLGLSATRFGLAVSAFFWTYGLTQPFIGALADRWSAARLLSLAVALWACATLFTGLANGLAMLVGLRLLLGLGEAALFPSTAKLIAAHVPVERRGLANAMIATGLALGPALGTMAGGMILARHGWRPVFFWFGAATLVWLVPWALIGRQMNRATAGKAVEPPSPMRDLLRRPGLWLMGVAHALANYGFFFVLIWLPLYLVKSRGLPIPTMTVLATMTYGMQALASLGWGQLADALVRRGGEPSRVKRRLCVVAELGSVAGIAGVALAQGTTGLCAALLVTGLFLGCLPTMVYALGQLHAGPRDAAGWVGVQNAIGSVSGIVGPVVTGAIVDATGSFNGAFAFAAAVSAAGAAMFAWGLPERSV
ncbi:major facilitator transporter [Novosphingobium nitrogenifigens DSM 19370]|uniref:Major facilitator transporter n=1 Tax=Novosphingobium nitrogenifigens DSM 19370 TaxID=983920 RepID=F1Z592_9SPHN|nr:MFS transporter [Novosphingobium nitrogenifigens]EGD60270.1 major facilitator transporter [Novosphingobium nitrogenifigens DSM 19370]